MSNRRRRITNRSGAVKAFRDNGMLLLKHAEDIWAESELLDTAVRDSIAEGLGHIVRSAYDSIANSMEIPDVTAWMAFIDNSTAEWFRQRGFAEWFCVASACGFNCSRPPILSELFIARRRKRTRTKKTKVAA